jgi:hypothetical protein
MDTILSNLRRRYLTTSSVNHVRHGLFEDSSAYPTVTPVTWNA